MMEAVIAVSFFGCLSESRDLLLLLLVFFVSELYLVCIARFLVVRQLQGRPKPGSFRADKAKSGRNGGNDSVVTYLKR